MPIEHLSPQESPERVAEVLARDGCAVIDKLESTSTLDRIRSELEPWFDANKSGQDEFSGQMVEAWFRKAHKERAGSRSKAGGPGAKDQR